MRPRPRTYAITGVAIVALLCTTTAAWAGVCGAECPVLEADETCCDHAGAPPVDDVPELGQGMGCCETVQPGCAVANPETTPVNAATADPVVAPDWQLVALVSAPSARANLEQPALGPPPARAPPTRTVVLLL